MIDIINKEAISIVIRHIYAEKCPNIAPEVLELFQKVSIDIIIEIYSDAIIEHTKKMATAAAKDPTLLRAKRVIKSND